VPIFLERFVLPVLATAVIVLIVLNQLKLDLQQRIALLVGVLAFAYLIGYSLTKGKSVATQTPMAEAPSKSGDATTSGSNSPGVTGNGNTFQYDQSSPPQKQKPPK
jgi:hypothetical protein